MTDCVLRAPVQFRQRRLKVAIGPLRHFAATQPFGRFRINSGQTAPSGLTSSAAFDPSRHWGFKPGQSTSVTPKDDLDHCNRAGQSPTSRWSASPRDCAILTAFLTRLALRLV